MKNQTLFLLLAASSALAQGAFQNLDFESANLPFIPPGQYGSDVAPSNAFPGWTVDTAQVLQNNFTLGVPSVDIFGPCGTIGTSEAPVIDEFYSALLVSGYLPDTPSPIRSSSLSQIGQVPATAHSIQLKVIGDPAHFTVSLAGQVVPLTQIGTGADYVYTHVFCGGDYYVGPTYTLYGADVSQFAGQTVELKITEVGTADSIYNRALFDDIQFSPSTIPEPNVLTLSALGAVLLTWRFLRQTRP